jgi:hypothetical protein
MYSTFLAGADRLIKWMVIILVGVFYRKKNEYSYFRVSVLRIIHASNDWDDNGSFGLGSGTRRER